MKTALVSPIVVACKCGNEFFTTSKRIEAGRGVYCSKKCMYKYRTRPNGLNYKIVNKNPTWIKSGQRLSPKTEFKRGQRPHNFLENGVGYHALHDWVNKHKGKAIICEKCGSQKSVQWANKSHEYKRDLSDWLELCRKCHVKYDRSKNQWGTATKKFNLRK